MEADPVVDTSCFFPGSTPRVAFEWNKADVQARWYAGRHLLVCVLPRSLFQRDTILVVVSETR